MHTLLLVDDDTALLLSLTATLSPFFRVLTAKTGHEAVRILNEESVGVVVTDYQMTGASGLELVQFVSAIRPRPPVILLSAYVDKDVAIRSLNSGVFAIVEKPFFSAQLITKINEALAHFLPSPTPTSPDDIELAPDALEIGLRNRRIKLTATEYEIFSTLYANQGQWVSRTQLEHSVYQGRIVSRNLLDTHVSNLRKKVPELKTHIQALRGRGYVFRPTE